MQFTCCLAGQLFVAGAWHTMRDDLIQRGLQLVAAPAGVGAVW
jgi:hypothetical protein